jgi:shikimate kinase
VAGSFRYNAFVIASRQPSRSIVLTGFHGCGAMDVGRELARRMRRQLVDWESELERRSRRDLLALLNIVPEQSPGLHELRIASELAFRRDCVIVLGPAAIEQEVWPQLYIENTLSCFIDHPFELLWQRIQGDPQSREYLAANSIHSARADWERLYPRFAQACLRLTNPPNPPRQARVILHSFYT